MTVVASAEISKSWPFPERRPEENSNIIQIQEPMNDADLKPKPEAIVIAEAPAAADSSAPEKSKYPKYLHIRVCENLLDDKGKPEGTSIWPCGGFTIAYEVIPDIRLLRFAVSKCSIIENFSYIKARLMACKRLYRLKWKPRWKMDSNEMRDYIKHPEYFAEYDLGYKDVPREIIIDHMAKLISEDRTYQNFSLNPVQRRHYRVWGLL